MNENGKIEFEQREKKYWRCEEGLHREEIPQGSILEIAWNNQNEKGTRDDIIVPKISCPQCSPTAKI